MAYRKEMPKDIDKKVFNNTAKQTRKINISPRISRGGTRL